ncbi:MAG: GxxExxY protein [Flavobacteriales bacterium]|jgi:GxxExxY protein|nr:GxxExxY protein [Flavobacteriales bacterium]MBK6549694.1 GxxExxY protein [Flavobacteriales bacterium]MBK7102209.1 GxxExxY protein [Flavobacteriales bacterium]MBK7112948.1 GxxExxY protein [Flavobacteriales bacterium]MBK7619183.1 GxxExxY protein [Flavobacteriales bacterium]
MTENELSKVIVNAAFVVHKELGPGLLENIYEHCLAAELRSVGIEFEQQRALPVVYKGQRLDLGYRLDLLVEKKVVVEVKATDGLNDIHMAQVLTYLKLSGTKLGLLINFNEALIKRGIRRVVRGLREDQ